MVPPTEDEWADAPTLMALTVGRDDGARVRDAETVAAVEKSAMETIADAMGARAVHTGQLTRVGNPWDFELHYPNGRRGLGEHVLYVDPKWQDAPENPIVAPALATGWDPDSDFRVVLGSPAVQKHIWRVSAWHSDRSVALDESHLVIQAHSVVPAVELVDVWEKINGRKLSAVRSSLTYGEIGDVTHIWIFTDRSPNALLLTHQAWFPLHVELVDP